MAVSSAAVPIPKLLEQVGAEIVDAGYRIDLPVNGAVIVEVKSVDVLASIHQAQPITHLKLSGHRLGYLVNFNLPLFKNGLKRVVH